MPHGFKLPPRRLARLRTPVAALILISATLTGCDHTDSFTPDGSTPPEAAGPASGAGDPALSTVSFAGGIPIGTFAQPTTMFGDRFNGAQRNILPDSLLRELAEIKARGGKVSLMFAGKETHYKDDAGHFSLSKWKARVDRFASLDFSSYIDDGTIIGHYLIDEPNDPVNWNGQPIPGATLEEMAQYSKQLWPNLVTIVRTEPGYLGQWSISYRYLDAAWAQYVHRKGDVNDYILRNVADAQNQGLGLVVGLNIRQGGPDLAPLTASQLEEWGSALLSSLYPCAFISWQYDSTYLSGSGIGEALDVLRSQAQNRSTKSCRNSAPPPEPEPATTTTTIASDDPDPSTPGQGVTVNVDVTAAAGTPTGTVTVTVSGGGESCTATLSAGSGSCSLTLTATGDRSITAAHGGSASFAPSSDTEPHTVQTALQEVVITWPTPQDITYGTALGAAQLNATASSGGQTVPGTFSYDPAAGTILGAGQGQTLAVTFTPSDPDNYAGGTATAPINVLQAATSLSWTVPPSTLVGPLDGQLLTATATGVGGVPLQGTFTYTPAAGTVLDASRSRVLSVVFWPAAANYATATKTVSLAVLYPFSGFFEPVNNPRVLNTAKAGKAIPVRFGLGGNWPLPIFAVGSPKVSAVSCPGWATDAIEQTVSATTSGLAYDAATGQYVYTWKTATAWAGSCRKLVVTLKDGTRHEAVFKLVS